MAKKILIVTKDRMEFFLYHPIAETLKKLGFEVIIVAEGLSMQMWIDAGWEIYNGLPNAGDFDPNTKIRADIDAMATLATVNPNLVLTGLAAPINLGEQFGIVANRFDIKLGFVEDLWGVHKRSRAIPQFVCASDEYGARLIGENQIYCVHGVKPLVIGSPAMDALQNVKPDADTKLIVENSGAKRVILIGGQDESTSPLVQGLLEASYQDEGWFIIPRFHPKWMTDPTKAAFREEWMKLIYRMEVRHRVLWTPPSTDMRTLIPLATHVVSIYSNCLIEAVGLGALPVSWTSDIGRQKMKESLGVDQFPAVELGACLEVSNADGFIRILEGSKDHMDGSVSFESDKTFTRVARHKLGLDGRATERVVDVIISELG